MRKFITFILVVALIGVVCIMTCPDRQAHKDTLMSVINTELNREANDFFGNEAVALFGASVGTKIIEVALNNRLDVKNYFIFSIGRIYYEDEPQTISIGILGHVFTISDEQFHKVLEEFVY